MSKYTTELRFICEMASGLDESKGYNDIEEIVTTAAPHIFNDYPIFDEEYRPILEKKILMHYYTREICEETVGLWKLRLASRMNEIMPYFNKLYESELLRYNPLMDVDYTEQHTGSGTSTANDTEKRDTDSVRANNSTQLEKNVRTDDLTITENTDQTTDTEEANISSNVRNETVANTGTIKVNTDGSSNRETENTTDTTDSQLHWDLYSDTPQGTVEDIVGTPSEHNRYLTNARENTDTDTFHSHSTGTDDETHEDETTTENDTKTNTNANDITNNSIDKTDTTERHSETAKEGTVKFDNTSTRTGSDMINEKTKAEYEKRTNTTDEYTLRKFGKRGEYTYARMVKEFRDTFLNIDEMIINKLADLFILLW